ncbi:hypothetical protein SASPL_127729 [Salvia splendens]|uniref:Protein FAM33A n=1 Tax=Salvia splendens TaxID=180675 RepID=A0A8X8XB57_SALSN|nr:hypothetical protein SASPL_127729 [Salvia splendens]
MEHNQAVDGLLNLFSKANRDLSAVQNKLHKEFQQVYPDHVLYPFIAPVFPSLNSQTLNFIFCQFLAKLDCDFVSSYLHLELLKLWGTNFFSSSTLVVFRQANPMKLVERLKKIEEEMSSLKDECRELLAAKQVLPSQNMSCDLVCDARQSDTNQKGAKKVWCVKEDIALMSSWCTASDDKDLIDKARTVLVGNRTLLHKLQSSTGVPLTKDADDDAYESFNQVINEWAVQVKSRKEEEAAPDSGDINQMLFSAIVQSN